MALPGVGMDGVTDLDAYVNLNPDSYSGDSAGPGASVC
jgi:hypothetical protein